MKSALTLAALILIISPALAGAQQQVMLPNLKSMKHLTTKESEHAQDIPGKETNMDFYEGQDGLVYTVYSYQGKTVAFSSHSNSDPRNTYKFYMDLTGNKVFQQVNAGPQWQLPDWARRY